MNAIEQALMEQAPDVFAVPREAAPVGPIDVTLDSATARARAYLATVEPAIEGQGGDAATYRAACLLVRDFNLSEGDAVDLLSEWNASCVPPWTLEELQTKVRNAARYGAHAAGTKLVDRPDVAATSRPEMRTTAPQFFNYTDSGNAEYFADRHSDDVRYDHRRGRWLVWKGHRWQPDVDGQVNRLAKAAMRQRYSDAATIPDLDDRARAAKWAITSESRAKLDAMLASAQSERLLADPGAHWDVDPWLVAAPNGVIDLRTGILRPGKRNDRITMQLGVSYDADAQCPRWEKFLREVFNDAPELVGFVHRAIGYSMTGDTSEQCLFLDYGAGSNGKGTLTNTVRRALGDYGANMPFSTFEMHQRSAIPNDVAALVGRRFVVASETNDGTRLNEARVKALTGCDPITARFLHGEFFEFQPVAKFWLSVNHKPVVRDDSHGFWRRIRLIPFLQTFPVNKSLDDELRAEMAGILAWAVRGCREWQRHGLDAPAAVLAATSAYKQDSDPLAMFLDEACIVEDGSTAGATELYQRYKQWAERHGMTERERLTATMFGRKLADRFTKDKNGQGCVIYRGLTARTQP